MAAAVVLPLIGVSSTIRAQSGAMVQALPPAAAVERLNSNLAKLSRTPQNVDALLGAGQAALDLGDVQAANGFFTRANMVNASLPEAKLGLAVVQLALKQPEEAAANFDAAERLGASTRDKLADRGLAYDLTGQQAKAQRDYLAALQINPGDNKARLRYAVSLGISGRLAEAEKLLEPALKGGDREAWRFRAFIYAMNGRTTEARNITQSVMPKGLADALEPYMVRVPLLTTAQKASAAHFGDFPANVLRMTPPPAQVAVAAVTLPAAAAPVSTKRLSRKEREAQEKAAAQAAAVARAAAQRQPEPAGMAFIPPPPPPADNPPPRTVQMTRAETQSARPLRADTGPTPTPATPTPATTTRAPLFTVPAPTAPATVPDISPARPSTPPAQAVVQPTRPQQPSPQPAQTTPPRIAGSALADALSGLTVPVSEQRSTAAVDLNSVAKARADRAEKAKKDAEAKAKAEKDAKAKVEAAAKKKLKDNPSRTWVQIAAGKNVSALAFDLRRFRKSYADAIGDESGWYTDWGATNRLLIGPYRKDETARATVAAIKKAGGDAFLWQSDAGEEVKQIGAK